MIYFACKLNLIMDIRECSKILLKISVFVIIVATTLQIANADGVIGFETKHVAVQERQYEQATFNLRRESGTTGPIFFFCRITNSTAAADFVSVTDAKQFADGANSSSCIFTVQEDSTPEANETFTVQIFIQSGVATIGPDNTSYLTILSNDDPYGIIQFQNANERMQVQEPLQGQQSVATFNVMRRKGTFGTSMVFWQASNGMGTEIQDFSPTSGVITFQSGESVKQLNVSVVSDKVPENNEQFTINLINATGGAVINASASQAYLDIPANEPPIRFLTAVQTVSENQTLLVTVTRGRINGGIIGTTNIVSTINYTTVDGSARAGTDYQAASGMLSFSSGETNKTISILIEHDQSPELAENFTLVLSNPSPGSVLGSPSMQTVVIQKSDDPHGVISFANQGQIVLDEDAQTGGTLEVNRLRGTFGTVSVAWRASASSRSQGVLPNQVLNATTGTVTFNSGASKGYIYIAARQDMVPEEAAEFSIQLFAPSGGAKLELGLSQRTFLVQDSDNAYGVVLFGNASESKVDLLSTPRRVLVPIRRTGGALASVRVNYTVSYLLPGSSIPSNDVTFTFPGFIVIANGSTNSTIEVAISESSFLRSDGAFLVTLISAHIEKQTFIEPKSPILGNPRSTFVNITSAVANGEISFFGNPVSLNVNEPADGQISNVSLLVMRDGVSGPATVRWRVVPVTSTFTLADASPWNGTVYFPTGVDRVNLTLSIHPDNIPEINEVFTVELTNVTERNERIRAGASRATVTILQNDAAGGIFEFSSTESKIIMEGSVSSVDIVRLNGSLTTQRVLVEILRGQVDFVSYRDVLTFFPNTRRSTFHIFTRNDDIPEARENFTMTLTSIDDTVLGRRTSLVIIIPQNDDANGVFSFANTAANLAKYADEIRGSAQTVSFEIQRQRGNFSSVSVFWNVTSLNGTNASLDLETLNGVVHFSEGQSTRPLIIRIKSDVIPEGEERFQIQLINITGGGRLVQPLMATLIVNPNDAPIHFLYPLQVEVIEGQTANLTISLNRTLSHNVTVFYSTIDGTAMASSGDYVAVINESVVFQRGEKQKTIHMPTIDDNVPEIAEEFIVRLQSSTGDTIIIPPSNARVIISANDDPYGVFQFSQDSLSRVASEGDTLQFNVLRSRGAFGSVTVSWEILSSRRSALQDNGDFVKAKGGLIFPNGSNREVLSVVVRRDLVPELNETFYLRLTNVTGNFAVPRGGYLGNRTEATILVLPNDDPYGVIEFALSSSQVSVAEDYLPGFINATYANLTVDRKQGTVGSTKVVWQLYKAAYVPGDVWDLIFYGQRGSDVMESVGRNNSGTPSISFNSSNTSYIYVSPVSRNQPPSASIQDGFSISLWMKPKKNSTGTLIAKRDSSNNAIIYQLSINTSAGRPYFIFQVNAKLNNISVPSSLNIFDGAWHSLVLTMSRSTSIAYVDATASGFESLSNSVSGNTGYIYLGCSLPALDHYEGALQDVRLYSTSLLSANVNEIASTIKALRPVSGYLTYGPGVSKRHIFMQTMDNSVPEVERFYSVKLIGLTGDGRLGTTTASRVTILKSDNANGQFGFMQSNCQSRANESDSSISFPISRTGATFGSVQINWEIREIGGIRSLASADFHSATGSVTFAQGEGQKSIVLRPLDDSLPELAEHFELRLVSVISTDGTVSSTPTSGASIRSGANTCNITLASSDNPYGVFQITGSRPIGTGIIPKMNQPENIQVAEEAGVVTLYAVRAQGILGSVTCEWKPNPITARSNIDYTGGIGVLVFSSGQNISSFGINVIDNQIPELAKLFSVQLYNPTGGAVIGAASYINITIMPSDDAYGVFSFANASMNTTTAEGSSAVLSVVRMAGSLGTVRVSWMIINGSSDFSLQNGSVVFTSGQTTSQISIPVIDDAIPELMESFKIQLTSVSSGKLSSRNIEATIRIFSNDNPYGSFEISPARLRVQERNQSLQLSISRRGGSLGFVRASYQTFVPSTSVRYATPNVDFVAVSGSVDFMEGQVEAAINVTVIGDEVPEADEYFMVNLTAVRLIGAYQILANSPKLGANVVTEIIIEANDDANGVLQLSSSTVVVTEGTGGNFLNVTRRRGTFGQVSVRFSITDQNTVLGVDYQISTYLIQFMNGQTSVFVPVQIIDDNQPEFNESFVIRLEESSLTGGAKLGSPKECVVTIPENDYPYGLIGFASGSSNVTVMEPAASASSVRLTVIRSSGTSGIAQIEWNATLAGQLVLNDVTPNSGSVQFLTGQSSQDIELFVNADNIPEDTMSITVLLGRVLNGEAAVNTATRSATINIPANDDPFGVVQFNQSSIFVEERDVDYFIRIPIKRTRGLFGTIRVFYSTRNPGSGVTRAQSGADFEAAVGQSAVMGPGVAFANASIKILKDNVPELEESFLVEITRAEAVGLPSGSSTVRLSEPRTVNVTIRANDQPYGLLGIYMKNTGGNGTYYAIIEPESGTTSITFEVRRDQGSLGTVSVSWRVSSSSSVNTSSDVSGVSGATLTFSSGENSKEFIVQVHSDTIPESDEYLIIELYDPRGGAVISALSQRATLVIMANDGVGGRIGFRSGSRSQTIAEGQTASLLLYRTVPAAGVVSLNWTIEGMNASRDFVHTSGVLLIPQGTTMATLLLSTLNDTVPETHETFTVRLSAPTTTGISSTGAATLVPGDSTATVVIGASDEPHGIIEFAQQPQPIRVTENVGAVNLRLVRIMGNIGDIIVHYQLRGIRISQTTTEGKYGQDFNSTANNTIIIPDGSDSATIRVNIIDDNIPEQDEAFFVNITSVALVGASNLTTPPKIGSLTYMQIVIQANDGTQGELAFAAKFERITVSEDIGSFNVTVVRHKGTFGNVYAFYYLNRLTASSSDFNIPGGVMAGGPVRLEFANGEKERNITVIINNDNITETDEQFEIGLTIQNAVGNGGVQIGKPDKALVTIAANDDANGVIRFSAASTTQYVTEAGNGASSNNTGTFFVERLIGLFGLVNVQWKVLGITNTSDVTPISGLVVFQPNVREQYFQISAVADNVPELRKEYVVELAIVSGGARLSSPSRATLVIAANDDPHGLLSIRAFPSMASALNVEESTKFIRAVVRRGGGSIGEISVQYYTTAASAVASSGSTIQFGFDQVLKTASAETFHAFRAYGRDYLLLASSHKKVAVSNQITSSISNEPYQSTLFRWQGIFVPILNITTDGGVKWSSFEDRNNTYVFAVNHGTTGRYETMSQLMRLHRNETLELVQNIATKGASDVRFFQSDGSQYMIVIYMKENSGNTVQRSQVFRWQGLQFILESAFVETKGGSSVAFCSINGVAYIAVANNYDSSSNSYSTDSHVYSWSSVNRRFDSVQSIRTNGASDADCIKIGAEYYLVLTTSREPSRIFRFNPTSPPSFVQVQTLASGNSGKFFNWNYTDYLVIASNRTILYKWNNSTGSFSNVTEIPISNARNIQPFSIRDPVAGELQYLATTVTASSECYLLRTTMLSENSDFVPRRGLLTFFHGQTSLNLDLTILSDSQPEMDESFSVELASPTGGSTLAPNPNLAVTILSNDNAYGRLAFADSALNVRVAELQWSSVLRLDIVREFGSFGQISLTWNVSSIDGSAVNDLYPTQGQFNLNQGVSSGTIFVNIRPDGIPELDEHFIVRLTSVSIAGATASNRGPTINHLKSTSSVTILANNDPYGVVGWKNLIEVTTEEKEVNSSAMLIIRRESGRLAEIRVDYETKQAVNVSQNERIAIPGIDYFTKRSFVLMKKDEGEAIVYINVRHDNITNVNEVFKVEITNVTLMAGTYVPNSPRLDQNRRQAEVVITEVALSRGAVHFEAPFFQRVSESVGILSLSLVRSNGSEGSVGVHFNVEARNASSSDYSPQNGLVTFSNNATRAQLNITIIDDNIAELDESFVVRLTKPSGGVKIGPQNEITVVITQNDYPFGLLSFNTASRIITNVMEGQSVRLTVDRKQGLYGTVRVDWSCGNVAQSDLTPWTGTLVFAENATQSSIDIRIINDTTPELTETFTCILSNPQNGAAISPHNNASITVLPNDKPYGIISVESSSRQLVVAEPSSGYDGTFSVSILRSVGFDGLVSVHWRLNALSGIDDSNTTFNATSGVLSFASGAAHQNIYLQVLDDATPEESKKYQIYLERTSGGAELDVPMNTKSEITVAASDNPYGIVQFARPVIFNVSESVGTVNLSLTRTGGTIGQLSVMFLTSSSTSTPAMDFTPASGAITFNPGDGAKILSFNIIDDSIPELAESFVVNITSVSVVTSKTLNYGIVNGIQVDIPPRIGPQSVAEITINANDRPYGEIGFLQARRLVHESDGIVNIPVNRTGGTFGTSTVTYRYTDGTALNPSDYTVTGSRLTFAPGDTQKFIEVQLKDDRIPEFQENFRLDLTSVSGPAALGPITRINITIETSDNPYGLFGIYNTSLAVSVANPNASRVISFPVYRKDGALSTSEVRWRISRNVASASLVTEDINPATGSLTFNANERGPKLINITILPAGGPQEPEEKFTLRLSQVTGGAALDQSFANVIITVLKKGYPSGLFRLIGTVRPSTVITEPQSGTQQIQIPVQREFGSTGSVLVLWTLRSFSGNANADFAAFNTSLPFASGVTSRDISISLLADSIPELDETFELSLVSASNGGEINTARSRINFTVSANDYPHGRFILNQTNKRFEFSPSTSARLLHFAIARTQGTIGRVLLNAGIRYSFDGSMESHTVNFTNGQSELSATFSIASAKFLEYGSNITISLRSASIIGTGSSMPPSIMSSSSSVVVTIPEAAANSILEFSASTRYPLASAAYLVSNVQISRRGLFGSVSASWRSGYPPGGFTIGSILPSQGTVNFNQGERMKSVSFQIQIPPVLQNQLIYAVYLSSSTPAQGQTGWPKIGTSNVAIADPHGLIEIASSSWNKTVIEGNRVAIEVRRLLSTVGTIRVAYSTQKYVGPNAATEGVDFTAVSSTFDMTNGQSSATIHVHTLEDSTAVAEKDEYFNVVLTSAQALSSRLSDSSPRLSANNRMTVTIRDNDSPFGVISFSAQSQKVSVEESIGYVVLQLVRTGGVFSRSTVLVRSVGGGESWQNEIISGLPASSPIRQALNDRTQAASASSPGQDYTPINQEIVFEEMNEIPSGGQIKTVNITISRDAISEPAEQLVVVVSNVTGGASLPIASSPLKDFSVVTINGNGLWNGEIGFTQNVASINEDASGQVVLPLERRRGSSQSIEVRWQIWSTIGNIAGQLITATGTASFAAGNSTSSVVINLRKDQLPEFASWFLVNLSTTANGAVISSGGAGLFSSCNVTILESDYPAGRIGFSDSYRFPVVTTIDTIKDIRVRRYNGTLKPVTVMYRTTQLATSFLVGDVVMTPAREYQDYTPVSGQLSFPVGRTEEYINIRLTPDKASSSAYPKVFNISLLSPTNGAILYDSHKSDQVIIAKDSNSAAFLKLRSSALRTPLTDREIDTVFTEMLRLVKLPPIDDMNQALMMKTIRLILSYKAALPAGQRAFSNSTKALLLNVYDSLLSPSRTDTRGKSNWAILLDEIAYGFLNDVSCPHTFQGTKTNFALTAKRESQQNLNGIKFTTGTNGDFFRYPVNMFSSTGTTSCKDIHFIDYGNKQLFSSTKTVLNNKVLSSKIKSGIPSGMKVVYRIHASKERVAQVGRSCVIWKHPVGGVKGDWVSTSCQLRGKSTTYVECECQHLSEYAVIALSDNRTGYDIYFLVSCYIVIGACFLALVAHHLSSFETTFTAGLLMHFVFAIMVSNILFVVGAYISPGLSGKTTECGILGISIHYFFLAQFTTIFAQGCNLWRIFIVNDEHTDRKYLHFFIIGWGLPIIVIGGYVLVTYTAYRWPFSTMYGDVNGNGDMCFMSNIYAALGSVIFPAILLSLCVIVVLVQSYYVKHQWKCYDDIYRERYNYKEMRHIIAIFALLCIAWLLAGLHLAYGYLWMIIAFSVFNIILGLYILVLYAVLRNQIRICCHGSKSTPSSIAEHELVYTPHSLTHSSRKLVETQSNRLSDWEDVELPMGVNPMDIPDNVRIIDSPDFGRERGRGKINESYDIESDEFDDLIFALKTGGRLTPVEPEEQELEGKGASPRPVSADQPQVRRIKIADTHL